MPDVKKSNILAAVHYNDKHYLKNIINGCTVEFNDLYYRDFIEKKDYVINELDGVDFFTVRRIDSIDLMIMLSSSCNLNCTYCFEKDKRDLQIQNNTLLFISNFLKNSISSSTESVNITYTGGEPLLAATKMFYLTDRIKEICKEVGITVNFSIITNGTLVDDTILTFLDANNFSTQITLDGKKELHNRIRYFDDHTGTFDVIIKHLYKIHSDYKNIHLTIRINISSPNFDEYASLIEFLFKNFPLFDVYIDFLDVSKSSKFYMNDDQKLEFYLKFLLVLKRNARMHIRNYYEGGNCMIRNRTSLTIDSDGNIYKCYSLVGNKNYTCGSIQDFINSSILAVPPITNKCKHENCLFYQMCYGGCPYKKYVVDGSLECFCKLDYLKKMNAYIFVTDIIKDEDSAEIRRLADGVKYFQIDFH